MKNLIIAFIICVLALNCEKKKEPAVQETQKKVEPQKQPEPVAKETPAPAQKAEPVKTPETVAKPTQASNPDVEKLSKKELWAHYKAARQEADALKEQGKFLESVDKLLFSVQCAEKLDRPDIVSWQYNNAAKHCIDLYKHKTGYTERMAKLNGMKYNEEKKKYLSETKATLKAEFPTLDKSYTYLQKAEEFDAVKPDENRQRVIASNFKFINTLKDMVKDN